MVIVSAIFSQHGWKETRIKQQKTPCPCFFPSVFKKTVKWLSRSISALFDETLVEMEMIVVGLVVIRPQYGAEAFARALVHDL